MGAVTIATHACNNVVDCHTFALCYVCYCPHVCIHLISSTVM